MAGRYSFILLIISATLINFSSAFGDDHLGAQRKKFPFGPRYVEIEVLDDNLLHFEMSEKRFDKNLPDGPDPELGIYVSPMVDKNHYQDYPGPTAADFRWRADGVETSAISVTVGNSSKCVRIFDKTRNRNLTNLCGDNLNLDEKRLYIDRNETQNVYGVGNLFYDPFTANGDWVGRHWEARNHGNFRFGPHRFDKDKDAGLAYDDFHGGGPSVSQFPMIYAVGPALDEGATAFSNYGLFIDSVYRMSWNFGDDSPLNQWLEGDDRKKWFAEMWGDQVRFFVITGGDIKTLRKSFAKLVGTSPVPPKNLFGLTISKFGYTSWDEVERDLTDLKKASFPVDGVALDLQWFGGTFDNANAEPRMGTIEFSQNGFTDSAGRVAKFREEFGVRFMPIEESYVDNRLATYNDLRNRGYLVTEAPGNPSPVNVVRDIAEKGDFNSFVWWGKGGMVDWSNPGAGAYWHREKRMKNLSGIGIFAHWLDLGEPEMYYQDAGYYGFPELKKFSHGDVHNVYNLLWAKSIADGYLDPQNQQTLMAERGMTDAPRFWTMSRAGTVGSQRYGGLWSGDVGRNLGNFRAHEETQKNMSMLLVDYYGSDAGGFLPADAKFNELGQDEWELYTQWLANNAMTDVPLRPHGWALDPNLHFTPDKRGNGQSNRANVRRRYELTPYLYSLAHRANRFAEPMFPPLFYFFEGDANVRQTGDQKMLGENLMFAMVGGFGQTDRDVYLPAGEWIDFHSNDWYHGGGFKTPEVPVYRKVYNQDGTFTVPLFARGGAIVPLAYVDELTRNVTGMRDVNLNELTPEARAAEDVHRNELRVRVYAGAAPSQFTLYEDDGFTLGYTQGKVRETVLTQTPVDDKTVRVVVGGATGNFFNDENRSTSVEFVADGRTAETVDGLDLCSDAEFDGGRTCYTNSGRNLIRARKDAAPVGQAQSFVIHLSDPAPARTSANFVCSNAETAFGEAVFVVGNIPELGNWDETKAPRLVPVRYDFWKRWASVVDNLPAETRIEWKCVRRAEGGGQGIFEPGPNHVFQTPAAGFAGTTRGAYP